MEKIAEFQIVSNTQFEKDCKKNNVINYDYNSIIKPKRATAGSAGYDFYLPHDAVIPGKSSVIIPTGIRVKIDNGWFLAVVPRSGLGFKYRLSLANTIGIIDSDYYNSDNEGHILIKIFNPNETAIELKKGAGFAQGIFLKYGVTVDDDVSEVRNGGFGSTNKNI